MRAGDGNRSSFENPKNLKIGGLHARQVVSDHPQNVFRPLFQTIKVCFFAFFMTEDLMMVIYSSGNLIVDEVGKIQLSGNIIPEAWFHTIIVNENGNICIHDH